MAAVAVALGPGFGEDQEQLAQLIHVEWRVAWLRLAFVIGLAGIIFGLVDLAHPKYRPDLVVVTIVAACSHAAIQVLWLFRGHKHARMRAYIGVTCDFITVTMAMYATGGFQSELYLLLYPLLVSVAMRFGLRAVMVSAVLCAGMYLGASWLHGDPLERSKDVVVLRIMVMLLTAALAGGFHRELARRLGVLIQTRKMRDDFLMVASHELKTPLVAIRGISQVLDRVMREGSTERALLQRVDASIDRMQRLIRDLTDAARVDAGTLTLERDTVDLVALARTAVDEARLGNPRREIKFRSNEELLRVDADAQRLSQVFANLLTNAIKFTTPDKGPIVLELRREGGVALATVRDKGLGIPADSLPVIFEKHGRSTKTPAMGFAGLGLGLYITRAIVLAHGGGLSVESREGEGSAFTVRLPLLPEPRVAAVPIDATATE